MDFVLTDEQKILRDNIVRFAREVLNPGAAERDREQAFSHELWRRCGEIRCVQRIREPWPGDSGRAIHPRVRGGSVG
jgi:alkylation response protein AidB-like acyl-CoA dehydrogenase